jgi:hypothetical protein
MAVYARTVVDGTSRIGHRGGRGGWRRTGAGEGGRIVLAGGGGRGGDVRLVHGAVSRAELGRRAWRGLGRHLGRVRRGLLALGGRGVLLALRPRPGGRGERVDAWIGAHLGTLGSRCAAKLSCASRAGQQWRLAQERWAK